MNAFQSCQNTSDAIPLYLPQQLYLKPIARLNISLQLPQKTMSKSISNLEVMEKLRFLITPEKFSILQVTNTNIEFIRFEAEIDDKKMLEKVICKLNHKTIKLKDFPELIKLRACETKLHFPTRYDWDTFFRDAKDMNEMKPGERPDTMHISNLPIKWFVPNHLLREENVKPSEKIFFRVFEKFGPINRIDIPICDPYRNKMKLEVSGMQRFSFNDEHFFEAYVQFKGYMGFLKAMDAFRGMKLLHINEKECYTVNISVDFDKTKHLSDASTRRREIVRDRLVRQEIDREEKLKQENKMKQAQMERHKENEKLEKERRLREREEKRKQKHLAKLKVKSDDEINKKIQREERKLLEAQRKLEAIRLVHELLHRIKIKKEASLNLKSPKDSDDEATKLKYRSEIEHYQQKERFHHAVKNEIILKNILPKHTTSDSDVSDFETKETKTFINGPSTSNYYLSNNVPPIDDWYGLYPYQLPIYPPIRGHPHYFSYMMRGRGNNPGPSRGFQNNFVRRSRGRFQTNHGRRNIYPPELQKQYYRYFEQFWRNRNDHSQSNRSKSRSRSPFHHKRSNRSRSRPHSRSYSRNRSRTRTRSHSRARTRSYSRKRSRSYSKSRSSSSDRYKKSKNSRKNSNKCDKRNSDEKHKSRSSSYQSLDSSKFISPSRLRMSRSKSWSFPKEINSNKRSWSKSASPENRG